MLISPTTRLPIHPAIIRGRCGLDDADELVTGDAAEVGVTFEKLKVRAADAGHADADATLPFTVRCRHVPQRDRAGAGDDESFHESQDRPIMSRSDATFSSASAFAVVETRPTAVLS